MIHTNKKSLFLVLLTLANIGGMFAQDSKLNLSFKEAVATGVKNNYALKLAAIDEKLAVQKKNEVRAFGLPNVSAGVSYTNNIKIPIQRFPNFINAALPPGSPQGPEFIEAAFGIANSLSANVTVSQLIFDGSYFLGLKASRDFVEMSTVIKEKTQQDAEIAVAKAYYMAIMAQQQLDVITASFKNIDSTAKNMEAMYEQGFIEKVDLERIRLTRSNLELQKKRVEAAIEATQEMLKMQMGIDTKTQLTLTDNLETIEQSFTLIDVTATGEMKNRVEYRMLTQAQKLSQLDLKRYKLGYMPTLAGFFQQQYNSFANEGEAGKLFDEFFPGTIWGLKLNVPIFQGLGQNARVAQAKLNLEKSNIQMKQFEDSYAAQINIAKNNYEVAKEAYLVNKKNVELAGNLEKISKIKLEEKLGTSLEYSTAVNDLNISETNRVIALYDLLVAEIEYRKAIGQKPVNY